MAQTIQQPDGASEEQKNVLGISPYLYLFILLITQNSVSAFLHYAYCLPLMSLESAQVEA